MKFKIRRDISESCDTDIKILASYYGAVKRGNGRAAYKLGTLYYLGEKVPKDDRKALFWYEKAIELGYVDIDSILGCGYCQLATWYEYGWGCEPNIEKALEYYEKALEMGDGNAAYKLGLLYHEGKEVEKDYRKALLMLKRSLELGHSCQPSTTYWHIGQMYEHGEGCEADFEKAREYYEEAAKKGSIHGIIAIGAMYEHGLGCEPDIIKAIEYYEKAVKMDGWELCDGCDAANRLGDLYYNGEKVEKDYKKSLQWYERTSTEALDIERSGRIGYMYEYGEGCEQNYVSAAYYYDLSAKRMRRYAKLRYGLTDEQLAEQTDSDFCFWEDDFE